MADGPSRALGPSAVIAFAVAQPNDLIEVVQATPGRTVTGFAPGDALNWAFSVRNVAGEPVEVSTSLLAPDADPVFLDPDDGLVLRLDRCDRPWRHIPDPVTAAPTYACDGATTQALPPTPIAAVPDRLGEVTLAPGETASYRAIATLDRDAGNAAQSASLGTIELVATASIDDQRETEVLASVNTRDLPAERGPLAFTGAQIISLVVAGVILLVIGGVFLFGGRRRRRPEATT